jgi:hypothetical protein
MESMNKAMRAHVSQISHTENLGQIWKGITHLQGAFWIELSKLSLPFVSNLFNLSSIQSHLVGSTIRFIDHFFEISFLVADVT